jgi:hypothetical protein
MDDLMQKYMAGIGLGSNLYGTGASTANNLANQTIEHGNNQAGLEYGSKTAPGNLFGQIAGGIGNAAMNYYAPGINALLGAKNQYNTGGH